MLFHSMSQTYWLKIQLCAHFVIKIVYSIVHIMDEYQKVTMQQKPAFIFTQLFLIHYSH